MSAEGTPLLSGSRDAAGPKRVLRRAAIGVAMLAFISADVWQSFQESAWFAGLGENGDVSNAVALSRAVFNMYVALFTFLSAPCVAMVGALASTGDLAATGRVLKLSTAVSISAGVLSWPLMLITAPMYLRAVSWQTLSTFARDESRVYTDWVAPSLPFVFFATAVGSVALSAGEWRPLGISFAVYSSTFLLGMQVYVRAVVAEGDAGVVAAVGQTTLLMTVLGTAAWVRWMLAPETRRRFSLDVPTTLQDYRGLVGGFGFSAVKSLVDAVSALLVVTFGANISSVDGLTVRAALQVVSLITLAPSLISFVLNLEGSHLVGKADLQGFRRYLLRAAAGAATFAVAGVCAAPLLRQVVLTAISTREDYAAVAERLYSAWAAVMLYSLSGSAALVVDGALTSLQMFRARACISLGAAVVVFPVLVSGLAVGSSRTILVGPGVGALGFSVVGGILVMRQLP